MAEAHKHAELICAWANGAEIEEYNYLTDNWFSTPEPQWTPSRQYRIAKKPEPPLEFTLWVGLDIFNEIGTLFETDEPNLKLYFDPETQKLIKAEVI